MGIITPDTQRSAAAAPVTDFTPVFVEKKLTEWNDLEGRVISETMPLGTPPEGWCRFHTVMTVQVATTRGPIPYGERVNLPGDNAAEAMGWLVANQSRVATEIRKRGEMKIAEANRKVVTAPRMPK